MPTASSNFISSAIDGAEVSLPACPRMIFVVDGSIAMADRTLHDDEGLGSESATSFAGGREGATVWRWEMTEDSHGGIPAGAGVR